MSKVEQAESAVKDLTPEELVHFRSWFAEFDDATWDQQIEQESGTGGKLDALATAALRDHLAGRSTKI